MAAYNDKKRSLGSGETGRNHIWWRGIPGEENVVKLDSANYDRIMSQTDKPTLIMFYAQWCGYSVSARRGFAAAAHQLEQEGAHVMFGAVDCDQCEQIRDRYREIVGFPSFVYFVKGAPRINYTSQRSQEGFYNWIRKMQAVPQ